VPTATVSLELDIRPSQPIEVAMRDLADTLLIVLRWDDDVALDLHVVEPGGTLLGRGDSAALGDNGTTGGRFIDASHPPSGWREQIFVLPDRRRASGIYSIYVDFRARGDPAQPPWCGQGAEAAPKFEVIQLDRGVSRLQRVGMAAVPCGMSLGREQRYRRIRP
jgi:hypothetical protein